VRTFARQGLVFAGVGVAATAIHFAVAMTVRYGWDGGPLQANFLGYCAAVAVSYMGNALLAFSAAPWRAKQMGRFLVASLTGLALGQAITWFVVEQLRLPFAGALVIVIIAIPAANFLAARHWVFRRD
jgi:putative flippase GtrA